MNLSIYDQQMQKALAYLEKEFQGLQVGRARTGLVENINVETDYGAMKMNAIALITISDNATIKIEPRDKGNAKHISNAIYEANLGVGVDNQGNFLFVRIPALTQERRDQIAKQVKAMGEETKANIRKIRQEAMNETKSAFTAKTISEDQHKANEASIEELTKKTNTKIDELVKNKVDEVMRV
ncbi:MAG: ribosome recycling factor [Candidatus Peribacteria bacterium]|jgi:ribosome recycling factor|nr:ribosome recycling factor [Candidatus Peribacteria bacterium]